MSEKNSELLDSGERVLAASLQGFAFGAIYGLKKVQNTSQLAQVTAGVIAKSACEFTAIGACFVGSSEAVNIFRSITSKSRNIPYNSRKEQRYNYGVGGAFTGVFAALFNAMNLDRAFAESTNNSIHTYKETVVDKSKYLTGSSWVKATSMAMARNFFVFGICGYGYGYVSEQIEYFEEKYS